MALNTKLICWEHKRASDFIALKLLEKKKSVKQGAADRFSNCNHWGAQILLSDEGTLVSGFLM